MKLSRLFSLTTLGKDNKFHTKFNIDIKLLAIILSNFNNTLSISDGVSPNPG